MSYVLRILSRVTDNIKITFHSRRTIRMSYEFVFALIFAVVTCFFAVLVAACRDHVHAILGFLLSSFGMAGLILSVGLEMLAVICVVFYTIIAVIFLLVVYPFRKSRMFKISGYAYAGAALITISMTVVFLRAGMNLADIESKNMISPASPSVFAGEIIGNYYFPLGLSIFLLIAVLVGGYMTTGGAEK